MRKPIAYYARPMSIYGTPQERRDIELIEGFGYEVVEFTKKMEERVRAEGMKPFLEKVRISSILFFRSFPCGRIGAGVVREIAEANKNDIPILELPTFTPGRNMTVKQTKNYLALHGQR